MTQRSVWWFLPPVLAAVLLMIDRLTKVFFLNNPQTYSVVSGWFWFKFQLNTDMALSLPLFPVVYYSAVGIVLVVLCIKAVQLWLQQHLGQFICVIVILAGAFSNLFDRFYYGGVIDFIGGRLGHVFNIADAMIVVSVLIWMIVLWKHDRKKTVQTHS